MTDHEPVVQLRADQCRRWRSGERVLVESYLERHAALRENSEAVLELILNEVILREAAGESPALEEYLQRFSWLEEDLQLLFEVHQGLAPAAEPAPDTVTDHADAGSATWWDHPPRVASASASEPAAIAVPGYEILSELGRGGMGVVYLARHIGLKRAVALKMVLAGAHAQPEVLARFQTEAEAVARLKHPHIVQIYEVGERDGCPYLCLELVEGGSLEKKLKGAPQPAREAARLVETLARAMQHVHQHGILHRDLKPSNILLTADGNPKITDFGLAKLLDSDLLRTPSEAVLGTPSYMAPEQADGRSRAISTLSDVYALGAILYELLTGRPPFRAATPWDTIKQVISQEPLAPTRLQPKVPRDLETICLKCLEKEPHRRYADAGALADDLARFQAGEPIRARPINTVQRAIKWARRRPAIAGLTGVVATLLLILVPLVLWIDATSRLRRAAELRQNTLDRIARFQHGRDEVLFLAAQSVTTDSKTILQASDKAAGDALAAVGLTFEDQGTPRFDPAFDPGQRAAIAAGGYELLLVLADATARPLSPQASEDRRARIVKALRLLDRAAALRPPTRAYHLRRARCLALLGDQAAAQHHRAQAAALPVAGVFDAFLEGVDLFLDGTDSVDRSSLEKAIHHFEQALRAEPDHFWSLYYLAVCTGYLGRHDLAKVYLFACEAQRSDFVWVFLLRGFAEGECGEFEAAKADFQRAEQLDPDQNARYALFVNRGALRRQQERPDEAAAEFERARALKPERYQAHVNLMFLRKQQQRYDEAFQWLDEAIRLGPPPLILADLQSERAHLLLLTGKFREAEQACDRFLADHPRATDPLGVRGEALLKLGDHAASVRSFTQYLERGGKPTADIYKGRGQAYMKLGDYPGSVDDYTRARELKADAGILAHRGWAYFFADSPRMALRDFEESLHLDPSGLEPLIGRGLARVALEQDREAIADAEQALRRKPTDPDQWYNIACIFARAASRHDPEGLYQRHALAALSQALERRPMDARISFWRDKVLTDRYLDSIRRSPEFLELGRQLETAPPCAAP
jgi:serine/threonine protein kinase/predicted Zn-dependent protease